MIFINNKHRPSRDLRQDNAIRIYCGRGSPLGNPFVMLSTDERDFVCDQYAYWFKLKLSTDMYGDDVHNVDTDAMREQLKEIATEARAGDVALECFCVPKRCHCETIKAYVEKEML